MVIRDHVQIETLFCPVSVELCLSDKNQQWGPVLENIQMFPSNLS